MAQAGLFGGFASDGSYRRGSDQLCKPVASKLGVASCEKKTLVQLSSMLLDKGHEQAGASKRVSAKKSSSKIVVVDAESAALLFTWDSGQILSEIGAVYLHKSGRWVAIEYTARFGGRQVEDLVAVQLSQAFATSFSGSAPGPSKVAPTRAAGPKAPSAQQPPAFTDAMKAAAKWAKRRKHAKAIAAYREALALLPEHPEALYRLARAHMANKDKATAVALLTRIPQSKHSAAAYWRVEARFDIVFKSLRAAPGFRKAVGIDRGPDDPPSLYECLVAFGGRWEQERIPCEQPQVNLDLRRNSKRRFDLVIRSKCQGRNETTRLDGSWAASGTSSLELSFPNTDSADDGLSCKLELCSDESGEDCLRCQFEQEFELLLRVVRR